GSHLVGHSYGGLLAMVAATRCPERVKSLVLIEPPAFGVTIHHPEVANVVERLKVVYESADTPEDFLAGFLRALGTRPVEPLRLSSLHRKAVMATMEEVEPWNITLELARLASYSFPKLVVSGDWHPALMVTAEALARELQAQRFVIKGVGHEIQKMGKPFNDRLKELIHSAAN
ncbi:MAG TPA: alpha/beta fold hydrolase, partial [Kofleriaceae bacterium]|nr:alpha/beta fold hydrolase [Kofleriaceae bacterium]